MTVLNKERDFLEDSSAELLEAALKSGAEAAEVCASYVSKRKTSLEKQDLHLTTADEGFRLGLRVLKNNRQGFSSCNTLETKELKEVALKAVQIATISPEDPYNTIRAAKNIPTCAPQALFDESLHELSLQTQADWAKLLRDEALKNPKFRINEGNVEIVSSLSLVLNSVGVRQLEKDVYCSWGLMGMGSEGSEITSFDYFHWLSRVSKEVPNLLLKTTREFTKNVLASLKTGPPTSYKGFVLLSPRAVIDILIEGLIYHLNGRNVVERTSRWNILDLGKITLNRLITLEDKPWMTERSGFTLFDREGTPTANRLLLEGGVLKSFLLDHYAAHALEIESTGNAVGGPSSNPTIGSHCLALKGGGTPKKELFKLALAKQKDLLWVHRFSGQVDPITGDFSGVAKGAEWCREGQPVYAVKETLISGNIFEGLGNSLVAASTETEVVNAGDEAPTLLIDDISVTAKKNTTL